MKQPRKDVLREQLALAADEIIAQRESAEAGWMAYDTMRPYYVKAAQRVVELESRLCRRWWHRLMWWRK